MEASNAHKDDLDLEEEAVNVCEAGERHMVDFSVGAEHQLSIKFMHRRDLKEFHAECFAWCTEDGLMPAATSESKLSLPEDNVEVQDEQFESATYLTPTKIYRLDFEEDSLHLFKQAAPYRGASIYDAHKLSGLLSPIYLESLLN